MDLSIGTGENYEGVNDGGHEEADVSGQRTIIMQTMEAENKGRWVCVDCGEYTMKTIFEATGEINRFCVNCDKEDIKEKGK